MKAYKQRKEADALVVLFHRAMLTNGVPDATCRKILNDLRESIHRFIRSESLGMKAGGNIE